MTKLKVLVCNDDGCGSPLLMPFLEAVASKAWCGELRVVVPANEQSWIAQAVTRHRPFKVNRARFGDFDGYAVEGTPADCASLGIHNLYSDRPDIVLSGVNIGENAGIAFYLSSGTVGAAAAAFLAGVRSMAVSLLLDLEIRSKVFSSGPEEVSKWHNDLSRVGDQAASVVSSLLEAQAWDHADLYSVNLPWLVTDSTRRVVSRLEQSRYGKLFELGDDGFFRHRMEPLQDEAPGFLDGGYPGDFKTLTDSCISITPVTYSRITAPLPRNIVNQLEEV